MRKIIIGIGVLFVIGIVYVFFVAKLDTDQTSAPQQTQQEKNDDSGKNASDVGLTQEEVEKGLNLQKNGVNGIYVVNLLSGSFEGEVKGKVLSDTNCTPDEEGISRCHNEIELDNQQKIMVVTPHNMQKNRCLRPGESVRLSKTEEGKVTIKVLKI